MTYEGTKAVLLRRQRLVFIDEGAGGCTEQQLRALEIECGNLGFCLGQTLQGRLLTLSESELGAMKSWLCQQLAQWSGANVEHVPLFRRFPDDIPLDTTALWWQKVLGHFLQGEEQPCIFCGSLGTTHVLAPCLHVVCDHCFDGSTYSACPICEHHVDRSSPFFSPSPERPLPKERVQFVRLGLGEDFVETARDLFRAFCQRTRAMSEPDKNDLVTICTEYGDEVVGWLPPVISVKENRALVFGTLLRHCSAEAIMPVAQQQLETATDILRLLASLSGADVSLQPQTVVHSVRAVVQPSRWWGEVAAMVGLPSPEPFEHDVPVPLKVRRFPVARLSRAMRRTVLRLLNELPMDRLMEDMLRHRSYWVWLGEFLHPHEYHRRYPKVAYAFTVLRKKGPDGTRAEAYRGFYSKLEAAITEGDTRAMLTLLQGRPGEFARRFDHLVRMAGDDGELLNDILKVFAGLIGRISLPVLVTLRNLLSTRTKPAPVRIYWPKGATSRGVSAQDERSVLPGFVVERAVELVERELLRRFAELERLGCALIDEQLHTIIAPFNEVTASTSALALPRGSTVAFDGGKTLRLFLHWCQPEQSDFSTDLDLSVGFYDEQWNYRGACSYCELTFAAADGAVIAKSAGDLQDAPYPDGATEFIDVHTKIAAREGIRYAVMLVNCYDGLPFSQLERGFAGVMARDDVSGSHFDPRTVEMKFSLQGEGGIYMPLVFDISCHRLHWLDVYSRGQLLFNNVGTSNKAIQRICPERIAYFASGIRMNMYELALLHGAARANEVVIRGAELKRYRRDDGEELVDFLERLLADDGGSTISSLDEVRAPVDFAALFSGDISLPAESCRYVLFPVKTAGSIAASDLLVG